MLHKDSYSYEYRCSCNKLTSTSLPSGTCFYSNLIINGITGLAYSYINKGLYSFCINNLKEFHDLYDQSDTFLLAGVFGNFGNKCIKIYQLNPGLIYTLRRLKHVDKKSKQMKIQKQMHIEF